MSASRLDRSSGLHGVRLHHRLLLADRPLDEQFAKRWSKTCYTAPWPAGPAAPL